ncbi:MAG: hypothetical protein ACK515_02260 [bacterium]|jgi:hypothetical protein
MEDIVIPPRLDEVQYRQLRTAFEAKRNVIVQFSAKLTEAEIRQQFDFLLPKVSDSFAASVLADLAEMDHVPHDLLERLFVVGDTACQVTICLRSDLSDSLVALCESSTDQNVIEHWNRRRSGP